MEKQLNLLIDADFNYFKYGIVKKVVIVLFVVCYAILIFTIGIMTAKFFLPTHFEALAFAVSFLVSAAIFDCLFRKLYKKIFSKKVRVYAGKGWLRLLINEKEILIQEDQIKKIKARANSHRIQNGGRNEQTKLIIYTTLGIFHFTNDQAIYDVLKLMKYAPSKKNQSKK